MAVTYNRTKLTEEQVMQLPVIGKMINKWRNRNILLLEHPTDADRLISVGQSFDQTEIVICDEPRSDFSTALDYIARGEVYVYE